MEPEQLSKMLSPIVTPAAILAFEAVAQASFDVFFKISPLLLRTFPKSIAQLLAFSSQTKHKGTGRPKAAQHTFTL